MIAQEAFYPKFVGARVQALRHNRDMVDDDIIERIRVAAKELKFSQQKMADFLGIHQSAVSNIFKRKRELRREEEQKLRDLLDIHDEPKVQWVPVIGLAAAGNWREAVHLPLRELPMPMMKRSRRAFGVEIVGDSMDILLPEGGWAVIDPDDRQLYSGKVYLIANEQHEMTIKRYRPDPARFEPVSRNPDHLPIIIGTDRYEILGRVISYGNMAGL